MMVTKNEAVFLVGMMVYVIIIVLFIVFGSKG